MRRRGALSSPTVAALLTGLVLVGCSGDGSSTSAVVTTTSTTTTILGGGTTSTTEVPEDDQVDPGDVFPDFPESFIIEFEERYLCDMGPRGFSDIHAFGAAGMETLRAPTDISLYGSGAMEIEASLRAGEVCSGSAVGNHSISIEGTVDYNSSGELELQLYVNGTWYETFGGDIVCAPGIPSPGPWEWPAELHSEYIFFAPIEPGAVWEKDVKLGMCTGTITRRLDF
jgi:hypothetical protein